MRKQPIDVSGLIVKAQSLPKRAKCPYCGKTFKPTRRWHRYDRTTCRVAAYQDRRFAEAIAEALKRERAKKHEAVIPQSKESYPSAASEGDKS